MTTTTPLLERPSAGTPCEDLHLPPLTGPAGRVHALDCRDGLTELQVRQGRVWLTCEGQPEDHFLSAGQRCQVMGPARVHLSAEGGSSALLRLHRGPDTAATAGRRLPLECGPCLPHPPASPRP